MNGLGCAAPRIRIDAVLAHADGAVVRTYSVPDGATVADVVRLAAADPAFANHNVSAAPVGVFGVRLPPESILNEGDRVEFYRSLPNDPKQARRARVQKARRRS